MPESDQRRLIRLVYRNPKKSAVTSNNSERRRRGLLPVQSLTDQLHRLAQVKPSARRAVTAFVREELAESRLADNRLAFSDQLEVLSRVGPRAFRAVLEFTREELETNDADSEEQAIVDR
jgi:hypothetical protein